MFECTTHVNWQIRGRGKFDGKCGCDDLDPPTDRSDGVDRKTSCHPRLVRVCMCLSHRCMYSHMLVCFLLPLHVVVDERCVCVWVCIWPQWLMILLPGWNVHVYACGYVCLRRNRNKMSYICIYCCIYFVFRLLFVFILFLLFIYHFPWVVGWMREYWGNFLVGDDHHHVWSYAKSYVTINIRHIHHTSEK